MCGAGEVGHMDAEDWVGGGLDGVYWGKRDDFGVEI